MKDDGKPNGELVFIEGRIYYWILDSSKRVFETKNEFGDTHTWNNDKSFKEYFLSTESIKYKKMGTPKEVINISSYL